MTLYGSVVRPAMFALSPERSHELARSSLRWPLPWQALSRMQGLAVRDERLEVTFAGVRLPGPVGLAAGFDKDCDLLEALSTLGFGFLCVGSIMPSPRTGNPRPRIVRLEDQESIADSMGVPSKGRSHALARLRDRKRLGIPLFANVGGFNAEELAIGIREILPLVDAVEISLMCPNVLKPGEHFDDLGVLRSVLDACAGLEPSLVVRVPNDTAKDRGRFAQLIEICVGAGVGGLKVGGGRPVEEPRLGTGRGTLHGRAIFEDALGNVSFASKVARGRIPIKGNGGISTADDVRAMLAAGACCVDLYSAFVYRGWTIARDIHRDLVRSAGPVAAAPATA